MLAGSKQKCRVEKYANQQLQKAKSELAGNCEVKRHVLAAIQRATIPGSTKTDKVRFDTLYS